MVSRRRAVRSALSRLAALALASCAPAPAFAGSVQAARDPAVDWSRAGGDLFGRPSPPVSLASGLPVFPELGLTASREPWTLEIAAAAQAHGLDPRLLRALVAVESAFRPDAVSPAGAVGLTQLMPGTAAELGVRDRRDPVQNLDGGARYLARQIARFDDLELALAAYNAGPERVARLGRIPRIAETQFYVELVISCYLAQIAGRTIRSGRDCRVGEDRP